MAKEHKAHHVETTDAPDVKVDSPVEVSPAEAAKAAFGARLHPKASTKARFEVLAGMHMVGDAASHTGSIVESDDDLVAIYGSNKFRKVE